MTPQEVIDIIRDGVYLLLIIGAPPLLVALLVGLIISLIQALTQIQEMTLTFVPKVIAMLLTLVAALPFMLDRLTAYSNQLNDKIIAVGQSSE